MAGRLGVQTAEGPKMAHVLADAPQKHGCLIIFGHGEQVRAKVATLAETLPRHAPPI
jgi:hypothetical protein